MSPDAILALLNSGGEFLQDGILALLQVFYEGEGQNPADAAAQAQELFTLWQGQNLVIIGDDGVVTQGSGEAGDVPPDAPTEDFPIGTPAEALTAQQQELSATLGGQGQLFNTFLQQAGGGPSVNPIAQSFLQNQFSPLAATFATSQALQPFSPNFSGDLSQSNFASFLPGLDPGAGNLAGNLGALAPLFQAGNFSQLPFAEQTGLETLAQGTQQNTLNPTSQNILTAFLQQQFSPFFRNSAQNTLQNRIDAFLGTEAAATVPGGVFGQFLTEGFGGFGGFL